MVLSSHTAFIIILSLTFILTCSHLIQVSVMAPVEETGISRFTDNSVSERVTDTYHLWDVTPVSAWRGGAYLWLSSSSTDLSWLLIGQFGGNKKRNSVFKHELTNN